MQEPYFHESKRSLLLLLLLRIFFVFASECNKYNACKYGRLTDTKMIYARDIPQVILTSENGTLQFGLRSKRNELQNIFSHINRPNYKKRTPSRV